MTQKLAKRGKLNLMTNRKVSKGGRQTKRDARVVVATTRRKTVHGPLAPVSSAAKKDI